MKKAKKNVVFAKKLFFSFFNFFSLKIVLFLGKIFCIYQSFSGVTSMYQTCNFQSLFWLVLCPFFQIIFYLFAWSLFFKLSQYMHKQTSDKTEPVLQIIFCTSIFKMVYWSLCLWGSQHSLVSKMDWSYIFRAFWLRPSGMVPVPDTSLKVEV